MAVFVKRICSKSFDVVYIHVVIPFDGHVWCHIGVAECYAGVFPVIYITQSGSHVKMAIALKFQVYIQSFNVWVRNIV